MNFSRVLSVRPFSAADGLEGVQLLDPHLLLLPLHNSSSSARICSSRILHLSLWLFSSLDLLLAILALLLNSLLTASVLITRALPVFVRRSLVSFAVSSNRRLLPSQQSVISISYAFLAAILLAKKSFWLFSALSAGSPCVPFVSSVGCKFQEFPVMFVYLHSLAVSLAFPVQMYTKGQHESTGYCVDRRIQYCQKRIGTTATDGQRGKSAGGGKSANAFASLVPPSRGRPFPPNHSPTFPLFWLCSTQQIVLLVLCLLFVLVFTAFDNELSVRRKVLINCSLPLAVHQKEMLFGLLSLILFAQLAQSVFWQFVSANARRTQPLLAPSKSRPSLFLYLALSFRDLFLVEAILWSLSAFLTGSVLFHQFVLIKPCGKCTRLLVQLAFTTLPLLVSLAHPILSVLIVSPISHSAQQLCPILKKALPEQEPVTPPLPRPVPTVRILVTEHF